MEQTKKPSILLIDDDDNIREIYAYAFRNADFKVLEARDGLEGLGIANKELPDIIFTGIVMPRMDGFTLMETLAKDVRTAKIPIFVSSHMGREEDRQKANKLGARGFIVRDLVSPAEAVEEISQVLARGGSYRLDFDAYALDAPRLAQSMGLNSNFQCRECNEKMVIEVKLQEDVHCPMKAKLVCPKCGWEAD